MNNYEKAVYKNRLQQHEGMDHFDYLSTEEKTELKHFIKATKGTRLKGFNGKAVIIEDKRPGHESYILQSYKTDVCMIKNGNFVKLWEGYSSTTLKHINIFRAWAGLPALSKYDWIMLETA